MWKSRLIRLALILAIVSALALILSPLIYRVGGPLTIGLGLFSGALALAALGGLLSLIGVAWCLLSHPRDSLGRAMTALLLSLAVAALPAMQILNARSGGYPPMHDITTDMENPPQFVSVLPLRGNTSNSTDYASKFLPDAAMTGEDGGKHYAIAQTKHYPDIKPVLLDLSHEDAFKVALEAAEAQGWDIVAKAPTLGRIEATDTSLWFGFKDDVVIRLSKAEGGATRIDVRSSSRVGVSDLGVNAKRVNFYLKALTNG